MYIHLSDNRQQLKYFFIQQQNTLPLGTKIYIYYLQSASIFNVSQISDGCMYKLSVSDEFMHGKRQIILSSHAALALSQ